LAEGSGIEVEVKASPCPLVYGTPKLLQQLLWNLVSNALAALSGPGQILLELAPVGDNWLDLLVEIQVQVFHARHDSDFSAYFTTKENGTGLGLPLCKQIAEFHGAGWKWKATWAPGLVHLMVAWTTGSGHQPEA